VESNPGQGAAFFPGFFLDKNECEAWERRREKTAIVARSSLTLSGLLKNGPLFD